MSDTLKPRKKRAAAPDEAGGFPSVRYFQVHFEHLHEQLALSARQMAVLTEQVHGLERQLARLRQAQTQKPAGEWPKRQPATNATSLHQSVKANPRDLN